MKTKLTILGFVAIISIVVGSYMKTSANWLSFNTEKKDNSMGNYYKVEENTEDVDLISDKDDNIESSQPIEVIDEVVPEVVYDGLTLDELSQKLNRSLNSDMSGKGYLIASHSLELGVDPYMATAIILQETGCKWQCSYLVRSCNNVGGQKGSGCGSYSYFNSLDEGIIAFIDNLYKNYISYGLYTPEQINPKYAEDPNWSVAVNKYIESIKAQ